MSVKEDRDDLLVYKSIDTTKRKKNKNFWSTYR